MRPNQYYAPGPWAVPASPLVQDGFHHPIVTWGNGTGAVPSQYTGSGQEMLDGVRYLTAQNASATSPLYNKLNTSRVASVGHSQGAFGALNAMIKSNGVYGYLGYPTSWLMLALGPWRSNEQLTSSWR